jgi:AI-2 transport protein TqsA
VKTTGVAVNRFVMLIAMILVVAALKLSRPVTLPLAAALCVAILVWPLQSALEQRLPRWAAFAITFLTVIASAAVVGGAIVWTVGRLAPSVPELMQRLEEIVRPAREFAQRSGISIPGGTDQPGERLTNEVIEGATRGWRRAFSMATAAGLALALLAFMLLETRGFLRKVREQLSPTVSERIAETALLVSHQVHRHFVALTITSGISGVLTGVLALVLGLNFALAWAIIVWLLNYIPTIGPILSVIPPTLYALLQFDEPTRPLIMFAGTAIIQFTMGNFIDPKIEGRVLSLSPLVVLLGVVFWGWLWGVAGAFLSVPLTAAIVVMCGEFEETRWVAALASDSTAKRRTSSRAPPPT